jgi:CRP-like cAMP-binding protein
MGKEKYDNSDPGGHLDVLEFIPIEYRNAILQQCNKLLIKKDHILWNQGDTADYIVFLAEGKLISTFLNPNGKASVTGLWVVGDILGAADLAGTPTRLMTFRCLEDSVVYTLALDRFMAIINRFPEVSHAIIKALAIRLRWVAHLEAALKTQTIFERICAVLLALAETFGVRRDDSIVINLRLTHSDLAAMVGTSRQTMNLTLHNLERKGAISLQNRTITITDEKELKTLAYIK